MDRVDQLTAALQAFNLAAPLVLQVIALIRQSGSVTDDETLAKLDAEYNRRITQAEAAAHPE